MLRTIQRQSFPPVVAFAVPARQSLQIIEIRERGQPAIRAMLQSFRQFERLLDVTLNVEIIPQISLAQPFGGSIREHFTESARMFQHDGRRPRFVVRPKHSIPQPNRHVLEGRMRKQLVQETDGLFRRRFSGGGHDAPFSPMVSTRISRPRNGIIRSSPRPKCYSLAKSLPSVTTSASSRQPLRSRDRKSVV